MFFFLATKKNNFFTNTLVLPEVEKKKLSPGKKTPTLGERSACLVFELYSVRKKQLFLGIFFACLGNRARWCSGYRGKTCGIGDKNKISLCPFGKSGFCGVKEI